MSQISGIEDYYVILGASPSDDSDTIKAKYRALALLHHPDKNPGDAAATARFQKIGQAWEVLQDAEKRTDYDANQPRTSQPRTSQSRRQKAAETSQEEPYDPSWLPAQTRQATEQINADRAEQERMGALDAEIQTKRANWSSRQAEMTILRTELERKLTSMKLDLGRLDKARKEQAKNEKVNDLGGSLMAPQLGPSKLEGAQKDFDTLLSQFRIDREKLVRLYDDFKEGVRKMREEEMTYEGRVEEEMERGNARRGEWAASRRDRIWDDFWCDRMGGVFHELFAGRETIAKQHEEFARQKEEKLQMETEAEEEKQKMEKKKKQEIQQQAASRGQQHRQREERQTSKRKAEEMLESILKGPRPKR